MTMRPVTYTFTPANTTTTGIATGLTGAGPWTTFTLSGPSDGLAHQLALTSAANLSGINLTVTGTDADGVAISETLAGPNATTVETTAFFATVTQISAASTLGANTLDVGWVDEFVSQTIPLEFYVQGQTVNVQVELTGTANFDMEDTMSDIRAVPQPAQGDLLWLNDANFTNKTASLSSPLAVVARASRLAVNSYTNGAVFSVTYITAK